MQRCCRKCVLQLCDRHKVSRLARHVLQTCTPSLSDTCSERALHHFKTRAESVQSLTRMAFRSAALFEDFPALSSLADSSTQRPQGRSSVISFRYLDSLALLLHSPTTCCHCVLALARSCSTSRSAKDESRTSVAWRRCLLDAMKHPCFPVQKEECNQPTPSDAVEEKASVKHNTPEGIEKDNDNNVYAY